MSATCPTRVAIEAEIDQSGNSVLKFTVTSGAAMPLRALPVSLDAPPIAPFIAMPPNAVVPANISLAGRALYEGLNLDPNFAPSVAMVNGSTLPDRGIVIFIPKYAPIAHNYPWEILHDGTDFVAPKGVAFTRTIMSETEPTNRVLDGHLKILSIIAASDVDGTNEWAALEAALASYAHPLECLVLVSDPDLKDNIAVQAGRTVEMVPENELALMARIERFAPHLCHIFCHGTPLGLQIANYNVVFGARPLTVTGRMLASKLKSAWLVCLNACSTGATGNSGGTATVGSELVEAGIPFVTCMREDVPAKAASEFTRSFIASALVDLSNKIGRQSFTLNFDDAMVQARLGLAITNGGPPFDASKEWTLPILCTGGALEGPAIFSVTRAMAAGGGADLVAIIREISDLRAALATGTFEAHRAEIEQRIASLTGQLSPPAAAAGQATL